MLRERPLHRILSARCSAPLLRSPSDTPTPSLSFSITLKLPLLTLLDGYCSSTTQVMQAAPGYEVVFVPPGVSRTLVPLDGALILQIFYGIVVALAVRPDADASCCFRKG